MARKVSRGQVEIAVTSQLDKWLLHLSQMDGEFGEEAMRHWKAANDVFYDKTQQYVHVDSGDLKASAKREYEQDRGEVTAYLMYEADYAIYEEKRGGSHAYMTRGWNATEEMFAEAMPLAFESLVKKWSS